MVKLGRHAGSILIILAALLWSAAVPANTAGAETSPALVIGTADTPPYSTPGNKGFYDLLVLEAFRRIGVDVEILHLPSGRSLVQASNGSIDGEYARISGIAAAYPGLIMVDEKLADYHFCAFTLNGELELEGWEDLSSWNTAYIKGWKILEDNAGSAKSITLVSDVESLFSLLLAGRVDVVLYDRLRGEHFLETRGIERVRIVEPPLAVRGMHLYLNRRHRALILPLEAALRDIKAGR